MSISALRDKIIKNSTIDFTDTLTDSKIFTKKDFIPTRVPMINLALSGSVDGGMTPGLTMLAGPSKHFKTGFALLLASAFLQKYPDGIILYYDTEFGTPQSYFTTFDIPFDSVVHTPITDIEQLKFDTMKQLKELERSDHVMIVVDSIGNIASKKEVDDALDQKSVGDMTRAKQLKSYFRMVTPHLTLKDIPMVVINHTYMSMEMYSKPTVSGGTGGIYSSDNIWVIGRQQEKTDAGLTGYSFVINVEKSRYVKEKSKIPITISFDTGINRWSGLFDAAVEGGFLIKPKAGWYQLVDKETGEIDPSSRRAADLQHNSEFWTMMLEKTNFPQYLHDKYAMGSGGSIMGDDES